VFSSLTVHSICAQQKSEVLYNVKQFKSVHNAYNVFICILNFHSIMSITSCMYFQLKNSNLNVCDVRLYMGKHSSVFSILFSCTSSKTRCLHLQSLSLSGLRAIVYNTYVKFEVYVISDCRLRQRSTILAIELSVLEKMLFRMHDISPGTFLPMLDPRTFPYPKILDRVK